MSVCISTPPGGEQISSGHRRPYLRGPVSDRQARGRHGVPAGPLYRRLYVYHIRNPLLHWCLHPASRGHDVIKEPLHIRNSPVHGYRHTRLAGEVSGRFRRQ